MYVTSIALLVPPKARVISTLVTALFLSGCGGGSSASSGTLLVTTTATTTLPSVDYLYADFPDFEGSSQTAFAIDTNTGDILTFDDARTLERFLNKQPDPHDSARYPPTHAPSYLAISHLSHQIGNQTDQQRSAETRSSLRFEVINQADPGHFFVFGRAGLAPLGLADYTMSSSYFCSHCAQLFGTADGTLSVDPARKTANLELQDQHIFLSVSLALSQAGLSLSDIQQPIILQIDGVNAPLTDSAATGQFFGPSAEQTGLVISALHEAGVFSAASFGTRDR